MARMILVDDEKQALREIHEELREQGWEVDAFHDPREALVALQKSKYDLAVFDIKMPGMNGVELLDKAKKWQDDMDVIFITAWPEASTAIDAVQLGAMEYLKRPLRLRELVQAVKRVLTQRALRLRNMQLAKKLEALHRFVDGLKLSQALQEILAETLHNIVAAISVNDIYVAFIQQEGIGTAFESHGLPDDQKFSLDQQLSVVKRWVTRVQNKSLRLVSTTDDPECPIQVQGIHAVFVTSILYEGEIIGALLYGTPSEETFSMDDERFLVSTGHLLSHIIERAVSSNRLKKQEELRQRYQDMVEYLRAVVGGVAHDLRNPLTIIGGTAHQAQRLLSPDNPVSQDLTMIHQKALQADQYLEELLGFCYHNEALELKPENLNVLIADTVEVMREAGFPERVRLVMSLEENPLRVGCDSLQLKRALRNVLQNAVRAAQLSGQGDVTVTLSVDNGGADIRIHNIGEPIARKLWEEIFKPRFTSKPPSTGTYQRSGYGLPVARGILRSHGGDVTVESSDRMGTTFLLTLPLYEPWRPVTDAPPDLDDIPAEYRDAIAPLLGMDEQRLMAEFQCIFPQDRWTIYEALLAKNKETRLTAQEQEELDTLRREADILTLRKAYAAVLLKRGGFRLPFVDDLPSVSESESKQL